MDEELLREFLTESNENLASIEQQLLDLEADPGNYPIIDGIFRVIHTVKGSCGFIGLKRLEKVAHAAENLLGKIRAQRFQVTGELVSLLLESTDAIKSLIAAIEESGSEPEVDHTPLCRRLEAAERLIDLLLKQQGGASAPAAAAPAAIAVPAPAAVVATPPPAAAAAAAVPAWLNGVDPDAVAALQAAALHTPAEVLAAGFDRLRALPGLGAPIALKLLGLAKAAAADGPLAELAAPQTPSTAAPSLSAPAAPQAPPLEAPCVEAPLMQLQLASEQPPALLPAAPAAVASEIHAAEGVPVAGGKKMAKAESSIRVDLALLDELMNQVGELVLSRNRLLRLVEDSPSPELIRTSKGISQITSRLQEKMLHTRMQPISTVWNNVPRILREISQQLGKRFRLEMEGEETELDRTILAALKDPLTHIIRNSCDHGIEMPRLRVDRNKPEEGAIRLHARQESGFIVIEISDDGNGIDAERVKAKAQRMGLISAEQAQTMSETAALQLIFHPGLSTVEQVSNLSGRGVGMDVVRSEIEKVGGTVEIESELGFGTTLNIRIPLTLAIIAAMIVESGGQRFAIPQIMVQELISLASGEQGGGRESIGGAPFFRLRGRLLPLLSLSEALEMAQDGSGTDTVVVITIGERKFGVCVDQVIGAEEIVVKPLGRHFHHLDIYGGCSILGDGMVVPILDCNGISALLRQGQEGEVAVAAAVDAQNEDIERQQLLLFELQDGLHAIPMTLVERIERLPADKFVFVGGRETVQYRGDVIQVARLSPLLGLGEGERPAHESCLIIADHGRRICLQVDRIVDIVHERLEVKLRSTHPCYIGTAIIRGRSTEVVDLFETIRMADPEWFQIQHRNGRNRYPRILFVEDTLFFRNLVIPVLESMACQVISASNGIEAQQLLDHETPDLILTDLDMPEMDGFQLAHWVRMQPKLREVPIVALSSLDNEEYRRRAKGDEFNERLTKFDRKTLIEHLSRHLERRGGVVEAELVQERRAVAR